MIVILLLTLVIGLTDATINDCQLNDKDSQLIFVVDHTGLSPVEYEELMQAIGPWFLGNFKTAVPCRKLASGHLCCLLAQFRGSAMTVIPTHTYAPMMALTFKVGNNFFANLTDRLSTTNNVQLRPRDRSNALAPVYDQEMKRMESNTKYNKYRKNVRSIIITISTSQRIEENQALTSMEKLLNKNKLMHSIIIDYNSKGQFNETNSAYLKQLASSYRLGNKAYLQVSDFDNTAMAPSTNKGPIISHHGLSDLAAMIQCFICSSSSSCPYSE